MAWLAWLAGRRMSWRPGRPPPTTGSRRSSTLGGMTVPSRWVTTYFGLCSASYSILRKVGSGSSGASPWPCCTAESLPAPFPTWSRQAELACKLFRAPQPTARAALPWPLTGLGYPAGGGRSGLGESKGPWGGGVLHIQQVRLGWVAGRLVGGQGGRPFTVCVSASPGERPAAAGGCSRC